MKRRMFLKNSCLGAAAISAGAASLPQTILADTERRKTGQPVIVQIFLRGGQDQLNTFVPYTDSTYYGIRPTIAVPRGEVIKVDKQFGFAPCVRTFGKSVSARTFCPRDQQWFASSDA